MPRERDFHDNMEDREWLHPPQTLIHYVRLRCLELAVRMADPEAPVSIVDVEVVANMLVDYVKTGSMQRKEPDPPTPFPDPDKPF